MRFSHSGASWNESHYSSAEFDAALSDAEATLDVKERKTKMQKVETILRDAALMVQPFWRPVFILASATVADPGAAGQRLIGSPVAAVTRDSAPHAGADFVLWEPPLVPPPFVS